MLDPGNDRAFLRDGERIYFSQGPRPIARLIQGIYDLSPGQARRILRARIYSSAVPDELELAMVKVAAKRVTAPARCDSFALLEGPAATEVSPEPPPPLLDLRALPPEIRVYVQEKEFLAAALALAERIPRQDRLYRCDRRVAALLVDPDGQLLAAALNSNASNRTRHAEVNLVQGFQARLPRGARIYVTLKCCKMCAAMIWCSAEDPASLSVHFSEDDPGPCARSTIFTPGSHERKRASRSERERSARIEWRGI